MTKRTGGQRRKTRSKFRKNEKEKGKISIKRYFQQLEKGERVLLMADPSVHKGMYFRRFHAKSGIISGKQGSCYTIKLKDGNKEKTVTVHPIHLIKQ